MAAPFGPKQQDARISFDGFLQTHPHMTYTEATVEHARETGTLPDDFDVRRAQLAHTAGHPVVAHEASLPQAQ